MNLDYTPTAPDGTVYAEAAWGAEEEAPAEDSAMEPADSAPGERYGVCFRDRAGEGGRICFCGGGRSACCRGGIACPAEKAETSNTPVVIAVIVVLVIVIAAAVIVAKKKKKS